MIRVDASHPGSRGDLASAGTHATRVGLGHLHKVHDACFGDPQARQSRDCRLHGAELGPAEPARTVEPVGTTTPFQLVEPRELFRAGGHDELAAPPVGDPLRLAEGIQRVSPVAAGLCLEGTGLVVQTRVDDTAVVAALMGREARLGFEHHDAPAPALDQAEGGREADQAAAHDGDLAARLHVEAYRRSRWGPR